MKETRSIKFVVSVALLLALTIPSFAATTSTISLSGSVAPTCSIDVTQPTSNSSLAITTNVTKSTIATIKEKSNATNGYTVSLSSANGWALKGTATSLSYTLSYGATGSIVDLTTAVGSPVTLTDSSAITVSGGVTKSLQITFLGASAELPSGDYTDTLTVAIAAK
jgi:hypothetical protein